MRASSVVMIYFVVGVVMWGGGAVPIGDAGIINHFMAGGGGITEPASGPLNTIMDAGASLETVVTLAVGSVMVIWNLFVGLVGFIHWPYVVLNSVGAPPQAMALGSFGSIGAFYMSVVRLLRVSA